MARFTETQQFKSGMKIENFLDKFFTDRGWDVEQTSVYQERVLCLGDRIYRRGDEQYFIEYKSGIQTFHTGNVFLETISVDSVGKQGWVYTCRADYIFYATLLNSKILIFSPDMLRHKIEQLKKVFREVKTSNHQNDGYSTHGLIIPLRYVEDHLVEKVIACGDSATSLLELFEKLPPDIQEHFVNVLAYHLGHDIDAEGVVDSLEALEEFLLPIHIKAQRDMEQFEEIDSDEDYSF